jgi:hypothetical protein
VLCSFVIVRARKIPPRFDQDDFRSTLCPGVFGTKFVD